LKSHKKHEKALHLYTLYTIDKPYIQMLPSTFTFKIYSVANVFDLDTKEYISIFQILVYINNSKLKHGI
jgi:hypothetical protein